MSSDRRSIQPISTQYCHPLHDPQLVRDVLLMSAMFAFHITQT